MSERRIEVLDGIRGLAILMILAFHYINNPLTGRHTNNIILKFLEKSTEWGWAGVDLFFVLSGFLIGNILLNNRNGSHYFRTFYLRRIFRILPTYLLLLGVFYLLKFFFNNPESYIFEKPLAAGYYFTFTQNFVMGFKGTFGSQGLGPTWSLAIEEQFYLLCPLLIYLTKPKKVIYWLLLFILLAPLFRHFSTNWYMSYTWFTSRMDSLAIGVLLAWYTFGVNKKWFSKLSQLQLLIGILSVFITMGLLEAIAGSMGIFKHTLLALFFALFIILALNTNGVLKKILSSRLLIWFGLLSYPLYLFHNLFNGILHQLFAHNLKPVLNTYSDAFLSLIAFTISIIFSKLVHIIIEQPLIRIGKRFKYHSNA